MQRMSRSVLFVIASMVVLFGVSMAAARQALSRLQPPVAMKQPTVREIHAERFVDNYAWLKDRQDPRVIAHLNAENAYADAVMKPTLGLQKTLFDEMLGRIQEDDQGAAYRKGNAWYYSRTEKGKPYAISCRRMGSLEAPEEVLLDGNLLAQGHEYFDLGVEEVSDDGAMLAYSADTDGEEKFTLVFKNLKTGELLPDKIENTYYGSAWSADGAHFFYTTVDDAMRPHRLWRHAVGVAGAKDVLVYEEADERFRLSTGRSRCGRYVLIHLGSTATDEWHAIDAARPDQPPRIIRPRRQGVEYSVEAGPDRWLIVTNDGHTNFVLAEAPFESPGEWKTVIGGREDVTIEGVEAFARHAVVLEREAGLERFRVRRYSDASDHEIAFDDAAYTIAVGDNEVFATDTLRFEYESPIAPPTIIDYNMETRVKTVVKVQPTPNYDASRYAVERLHAAAPDGAMVPITVVRRKDHQRDGTCPGFMLGYGSYGASFDPDFDSTLFSLVDRGVLVAIAHVRGGSDLGRGWYEKGKLRHKMNTFTDFIACAEHLRELKLVHPDRLAILGGSAGGLLMGAVTNMRPDLFRAVIADVPFVDVVNTMLDPDLPLTVIEYEQWGNPNVAEDYTYIRAYSPYDNVEAKAYPHILALAGLNDPRVGYWEPAKWVARLRELKTDDNMLIFRINMNAGHAGASGRYGVLEDLALISSFVLDRLGVVNLIEGAEATGERDHR